MVRRDGPSTAGSMGVLAARQRAMYVRHPDFPHLPASVPLTYTLTMQACLSESHGERPTFEQVIVLLRDLCAEVAKGQYIDTAGCLQVWF
jgi:hypothetical protein